MGGGPGPAPPQQQLCAEGGNTAVISPSSAAKLIHYHLDFQTGCQKSADEALVDLGLDCGPSASWCHLLSPTLAEGGSPPGRFQQSQIQPLQSQWLRARTVLEQRENTGHLKAKANVVPLGNAETSQAPRREALSTFGVLLCGGHTELWALSPYTGLYTV